MKKIDFNTEWLFFKEGCKEQKVALPHDAMLYEQRSPDNPSTGACACFSGGKYHYVKFFDVPKDWMDKSIQFYFEGSYRKNEVFLNGEKVGECRYGYSSFLVKTDSALRYGAQNKLEVVVDNSEMPNSRWYTGSGIYRPVWLLLGGKEHIGWQGISIRTVSLKPAVVHVEVQHTGGEVEIEIYKDDKCVASAKGDHCDIEIPDAKFWSEDSPELYQCKVKLKMENGILTDEAIEDFGIRIISYSNKGLFINGKETLLRGGCVHSDNGILGARSYREAEWRRVRRLKETGFNAIRSSHNPCSKEMLKACDYYGMYLIDETWDMWYHRKNRFDYADDFRQNFMLDIQNMVKKDINHPSVIMYSIANEISEPAEKEGMEIAHQIIDEFHRLDKSRPVTGGINPMIISQAAKGKGIYKEEGGRDTEKESKKATSSMMFNIMTAMVGSGMNRASNSGKVDKLITPIMDALDIAGYNYASGRYPLEEKLHPDRLIYGSETFVPDLGKNWAMVKKYPYLIGDFMWTAWDYIGEAGSGAWAYTPDGIGFEKPYPWLLADMGVLDILGNANGESFYIAAVWGKLVGPKICVRPVKQTMRPAKSSWRGTNSIPSWSWEGCEGKKAVIEIYSNADRIELFCNGRKIGMKRPKDYKVIFKTKYEPGTLTAIAYDKAGNETGRDILTSAVGEKLVRVISEKEEIHKGDICYFNIEIAGENKVVESNHDKKLHVTAEGGRLLAFGSANPRTEESFLEGNYTTYYGRAQAVVLADQLGKIVLRVTDEGKEIKNCVKVTESKETIGCMPVAERNK